MSDSHGKKGDHDSRANTAKEGYDALRRHGINPDVARRTAEKASEIVHRDLDKGRRG
jgi:hypothetical protein